MKLTDASLKLDYNQFAPELAEAEYALGLFHGWQKKLENPNLLVSPFSAKEAAISSKIDGIQGTVSALFLHEAGGETKFANIAKVANYSAAIHLTLEEIQIGRAVSKTFLKELHKTLLKKPGGPAEKAADMPLETRFACDNVDDLLTYLRDGRENALIKAGIAHYRFEAMRPFEDCSGRIGRLLIPLILCQRTRPSKPILYISGCMEESRDEYFAALHSVDETGRIEPWMKFFLNSLAAQLSETQWLAERMYELYDSVKIDFKVTKSPYLFPFLDYIFRTPIFTVLMAAERTASAELTIKRLIDAFKAKGYIVEMPYRMGKAKMYAFQPLLDILG